MTPGDKEYLSKEKFTELKKEFEQLTHVRRKEIAEQLEAAKALGDLSENAEYHAAREAQAALEERIMELDDMLKNAEIVSTHHKDMVSIGSKVTIDRGNGKQAYTLVGTEESNATIGKISNKSPLGEVLIGKKKGDTFTFTTPQGEVQGTIISIE